MIETLEPISLLIGILAGLIWGYIIYTPKKREVELNEKM